MVGAEEGLVLSLQGRTFLGKVKVDLVRRTE
jgi:hypothetical protein